ncbi:hypothetical protein ACWC5I_14410 [Kitasatospora sp. NPDC001574]
MKITITVEDPTPEVLEKLLALASAPGAEVSAEPDDRWTVERARAYYQRLPPRAQAILLKVVADGGGCQADDLRGDGRSLRGSTGAFRRVLTEGARTGLWPDTLPVPVQSVLVGGQLQRIETPAGATSPHPVFEAALQDLLP